MRARPCKAFDSQTSLNQPDLVFYSVECQTILLINGEPLGVNVKLGSNVVVMRSKFVLINILQKKKKNEICSFVTCEQLIKFAKHYLQSALLTSHVLFKITPRILYEICILSQDTTVTCPKKNKLLPLIISIYSNERMWSKICITFGHLRYIQKCSDLITCTPNFDIEHEVSLLVYAFAST